MPQAAWILLAIGAGYYAGSLIGFALRLPASGIAFLWPPTAVLTAALLLTSSRVWWASLAGGFVAHAIAHSQNGLPAGTWIVQFVANAVQAVLAAYAVARFAPGPRIFGGLRSVAIFIVGAALIAPAVASLIPAFAYVAMGWAADYWWAWKARTLSGILTTLTVVPPIVVSWAYRRQLAGIPAERAAEYSVLLLGLFAIDVLIAVVQPAGRPILSMVLYVPMPFLLWAAVRFGSAGLAFALLAASLLTIRVALQQNSPFAGDTPANTVMAVQMFLSITAMPLMLLAALIEEHEVERIRLVESENRNAAILRAMPDLMFLQTTDGVYLNYYARNADELLVRPDHFLGRTMRDVLPPEIASKFEPAFVQATAEEPAVIEYSLAMDGEERSYEARVVALDPDKVLSIVRDITARKRAEEELRQAQADLARMARINALGDLSATIAHELNQPLCAIVSNANVCLRWLDEGSGRVDDIRGAMADVVQDGVRASAVISHTRELFANRTVTKEVIDVNEAIRDVLDLAGGRIARSGVTLNVALEPALPRVLADPVQIQQVVFNLVVNGIEAMRTTEAVERILQLRSRSNAGGVEVTIRDSGHGISAEHLERVFDAFYTTKPDGMGIGLSVSRSIVNAHGGRVWASANDGPGATFHVIIPGAEQQ